jgi:outer membrane protein, adhesin transport system
MDKLQQTLDKARSFKILNRVFPNNYPYPHKKILLGLAFLFCLASSNIQAEQTTANAEVSRTSSLPGLVKLAIQTNPMIKSKVAARQSADFDAQGANWQFYPTPFTRGEHFEGNNVVIAGLKQPLWTGGKLSADRKAAQASLTVSEWELFFSHHEIAFRVANAWLSTMSAKGKLKAAQDGLKELEALQSMMERRVNTGYSGSVDVNLVQARLIQTQNEIYRAKSDIEIGLNIIAQLTGETWSAEQLFMPALNLDSPPEDSWVESAIQNHPANKRALARIDLAQSKVQQVRTDITPTLSARAEYQRGQQNLSSDLEGYRLVIGFEQSFGAGLSSSSAIESTNNMLIAAREEAEVQRRELLTQIRTDLASLESARKRTLALKKSHVEMQAVSDSYRRAFDAGRRSWLELLNILRERTEIGQQLAQAEAEVDFYTYRLRVYRGIFE